MLGKKSTPRNTKGKSPTPKKGKGKNLRTQVKKGVSNLKNKKGKKR
jgi:hypothetical protein